MSVHEEDIVHTTDVEGREVTIQFMREPEVVPRCDRCGWQHRGLCP